MNIIVQTHEEKIIENIAIMLGKLKPEHDKNLKEGHWVKSDRQFGAIAGLQTALFLIIDDEEMAKTQFEELFK